MANFSWKTIIWFILVSSFIYFYYLPQAKKKFTSHQLQSLSQTEQDSELLLVKMMERLVIGNGKISVLWYLSKLLFHCGNLSAISHFIPPLPLNLFWELWPREKMSYTCGVTWSLATVAKYLWETKGTRMHVAHSFRRFIMTDWLLCFELAEPITMWW